VQPRVGIARGVNDQQPLDRNRAARQRSERRVATVSEAREMERRREPRLRRQPVDRIGAVGRFVRERRELSLGLAQAAALLERDREPLLREQAREQRQRAPRPLRRRTADEERPACGLARPHDEGREARAVGQRDPFARRHRGAPRRRQRELAPRERAQSAQERARSGSRFAPTLNRRSRLTRRSTSTSSRPFSPATFARPSLLQ
jgi:hypothetical protein